MKFSKLSLVIVPIILVIITSCQKEGIGGKASITGHVVHHEEHIPNAIVYIKYGAKDFPGADVSEYDDQTTASSGDGHYHFENLYKGNYYIYATGYDNAISEDVKGGIPVKISKKSETVETDVPVTE